MPGESSTGILRTYIFPVSPLSLDFSESSLEYICPMSPLREFYMHIFLVSRLSLDFGESSLECICPVSPLWEDYVHISRESSVI